MTGYFGKSLFTAFLSIFICVAAPALAQGQKTIVIAADEWCPINCEANGKRQGVGIDLARAIFEPLGYKVNYTVMPWAEALKQVRAGKISAVVGASRTDSKSLIFPDNPISEVSDNFYIRTGSPWRYQGPHTLKNRRIGITQDYGYGDVMTRFIAQNKFTADVLYVAKGTTPLKDNIDRLLNGKIDILVESKVVMDYTIRNERLSDKIVWAGSAPQDYVYLAFSPALPQSKQLAAVYDAAIRSMKTNGRLKQFYASYGMTP